MVAGRIGLALPAVALAGRLSLQPTRGSTPWYYALSTPTLLLVLISTILIIAGLSYFPIPIIGPVMEHFLMHGGQLF